MGFVSCHLIGQPLFRWNFVLHSAISNLEGKKLKLIEKQKFYIFYYLILVFYIVYSVNMAGTSTRQYNLKAEKQESLQFPVKLQLEDGKFFTELLNQQNGQVSDSESSISESD